MPSSAIGIYGGTFDPIHIGHLRIAIELFESLKLDQIRFIPSQIPVHRDPTVATIQQRIDMLKLALHPHQHFILDMQEIERDTPSYTYLTLQALEKEFPKNHLCLILGIDAFLKLDTWYEWEKILEKSHLILVERPPKNFTQINENKKLQALVTLHHTENPLDLHSQKSGCIFLASTLPLAISSTELRYKFKAQLQTHYLLGQEIQDYIMTHHLYGA